MADKGSGDGLLGWLIGGLVIGVAVLGLVVAGYYVGYDRGKDAAGPSSTVATSTTTETTTTETTTTGTTTTEPATTTAPTTTSAADLEAQGKEVFASAGCGGCHTLADAGASGTVGPDLDTAKPSQQLVVDRVTNGLGAMPAFKGQLSDAQIQAVATYIAQVAGG